jgi:hypothetical protein
MFITKRKAEITAKNYVCEIDHQEKSKIDITLKFVKIL